jgi:hypothetical protein
MCWIALKEDEVDAAMPIGLRDGLNPVIGHAEDLYGRAAWIQGVRGCGAVRDAPQRSGDDGEERLAHREG